MEVYHSFASVYDRFMEEVPYDTWLCFLETIFQQHHTQKIQKIVDLGCGTGNLLLPLAQKGYTVIGVDGSPEMLSQAEQKMRKQEQQAVLLCQDLTEFALPEVVDCVISVCDTLNYLTEYEELLQAFHCVNDCLAEGGLFCFDVNTVYKFETILGQSTFAATEEHAAYIWENTYDAEQKINEYAVTFFTENTDGTYERTEEFHYERAYSISEIEQALTKNGFTLVNMYEDYTQQQPNETTQRIVFVARKEGTI